MSNTTTAPAPRGINLQSAERQFASLLQGQLEFVIDRCQPAEVSAALREISASIDLAKHLGVPLLRNTRLFTATEISELAAAISPLCDKGIQKEAIRSILKEALTSHKVPHDLQ